jgi:hypothetical protein
MNFDEIDIKPWVQLEIFPIIILSEMQRRTLLGRIRLFIEVMYTIFPCVRQIFYFSRDCALSFPAVIPLFCVQKYHESLPPKKK